MYGSNPLVPQLKAATTTDMLFKRAVLDHFKHPTNVAHACLEFRHRFQGHTKSATDLLAALHELALDCEFPDSTLPWELALQILTGCLLQKAHERMLLCPINLEDYTQILETDEAVKEDAAAFAAVSGQSSSPTVHPLQPHSHRKSKPSGQQVHTPLGGGPSTHCFCCGRGGHKAKDPKCPALNDSCKFCHKVGHWETCCLTKRKSQQSTATKQGTSGQQGGKQMRCIEPSMQAVSASLSLPVPEPYKYTVHVRDHTGQLHSLTADVDMGSYCLVVERSWFDSQFPSTPLRWLSTPSYAFGGFPSMISMAFLCYCSG